MKKKPKRTPKSQSPVNRWPLELICYVQLAAISKGMCAHLDVQCTFLEIMPRVDMDTLKGTILLDKQVTKLVISLALQ